MRLLLRLPGTQACKAAGRGCRTPVPLQLLDGDKVKVVSNWRSELTLDASGKILTHTDRISDGRAFHSASQSQLSAEAIQHGPTARQV